VDFLADSGSLLLGLYILDKQARLQNVVVRLADVRLINFFEHLNRQAQVRQNLPVICIQFGKYIQSHFEVNQCDLGFAVVRTGLWAIVHALQSANSKRYKLDSLDSLSVVHRAVSHCQRSSALLHLRSLRYYRRGSSPKEIGDIAGPLVRRQERDDDLPRAAGKATEISAACPRQHLLLRATVVLT
jgi:hypothetical protein